MSDYVDNHAITKDFPEFRDTIRLLKGNNAHFSRILEKYEALDKHIVRVEQGLEHLPDLELDAMKLKRVQLKDDLVEQIKCSQTSKNAP